MKYQKLCDEIITKVGGRDNVLDVALWGYFAARVSNVHARSPSVSRRIQGGNDDFDEALMGSGGKTGVHSLIGDFFVRVGSR